MHTAFEMHPIGMIVEMDDGEWFVVRFSEHADEQGAYMMEIARSHEGNYGAGATIAK